MLHSWLLLFLRFLFWFFTSLINQLHQLACFSHENPWGRQLQYCEWYAIIIVSNSLRTLFVIPAAAAVTWFRNWAHWTTFVMHACDQERSIAVEEFLHHWIHKNSDRSSIWDWHEHAGVHKSTPEIEDDGNRMNSWILHSQCAHNYQTCDILSPLFRPTHITRIFKNGLFS